MIRLNRFLLVVLALLVLVVGIATIAAVDDSGSGSISVDDGSPNDDFSYGGDSNTGSVDADDEDEDDPLDEDYFDEGSSSGDSVHVSLTKHATTNPVLVLLISLLSIGIFSLKRH